MSIWQRSWTYISSWVWPTDTPADAAEQQENYQHQEQQEHAIHHRGDKREQSQTKEIGRKAALDKVAAECIEAQKNALNLLRQPDLLAASGLPLALISESSSDLTSVTSQAHLAKIANAAEGRVIFALADLAPASFTQDQNENQSSLDSTLSGGGVVLQLDKKDEREPTYATADGALRLRLVRKQGDGKVMYEVVIADHTGTDLDRLVVAERDIIERKVRQFDLRTSMERTEKAEKSAKKWTCGKCSFAGATGRFCSACGGPCVWTCGKCGFTGATGRFCSGCGGPCTLCSACGNENAVGRFCSKCGHELPAGLQAAREHGSSNQNNFQQHQQEDSTKMEVESTGRALPARRVASAAAPPAQTWNAQTAAVRGSPGRTESAGGLLQSPSNPAPRTLPSRLGGAQRPATISGPATGTNALLQWASNHTQAAPDVNVTNFTRSWADGRAFASLVDDLTNGKLGYAALSEEEKNANDGEDLMQRAFDVAESELGCPKLLDAEDIVAIQERHSIMTYLMELHKASTGQDRHGL